MDITLKKAIRTHVFKLSNVKAVSELTGRSTSNHHTYFICNECKSILAKYKEYNSIHFYNNCTYKWDHVYDSKYNLSEFIIELPTCNEIKMHNALR